VEPIQIDGLALVGSMRVGIPRRDAECVALLPVEALPVDHAMTGAGDDVVDGRGGLADCGGGLACGEAFGAAA
jgi:hypothetical protein